MVVVLVIGLLVSLRVVASATRGKDGRPARRGHPRGAKPEKFEPLPRQGLIRHQPGAARLLEGVEEEAGPASRSATPARAAMETGMKANAVPMPTMTNGPARLAQKCPCTGTWVAQISLT